MSVVSDDSTTASKGSIAKEHCREPLDDEPTHKGQKRLFYCKYCPSYSAQNTGNLKTHLISKHNLVIGTPSRTVDALSTLTLQNLYEKALVVNQTSTLDAHILRKSLKKTVVTEAIVSLIVVHNLPFRLVEAVEFHTLCKSLNPEAAVDVISSHSTIREHIFKSWVVHKDIIRKRLQSALSTIHISLDVWTSPNKKLFLGICSHFVDRETEQLSKALLGLPAIPSHHASTQHDALLSLLEDYDIKQKLGAIISDNASSNDKLCRLLRSSLNTWDNSTNRIRCNGHIINLAVQAFLFQDLQKLSDDGDDGNDGDDGSQKRSTAFRNLGPLGRLHNIIVHTRGSPTRISQFKRLAGRGVPLDNDTRWNSWYEMLQVAVEKEAAIDSYSKTWYNDLQDDFLSPEDWEVLRLILSFLKPFYRATKETEGDRATIDRVLFTMDILVQHFKRNFDTFKSHSFLSPRIQKSWEVFDKYYLKTEDSPYYAAAIILHPSRRVKYLKQNWEKKWIRPATQAVKRLWDTFKTQGFTISTRTSTPSTTSTSEPDDEYDILARGLQVPLPPPTDDEYDEYISEPVVPYDKSALTWWLDSQQQERWPVLSQLAINVLSIPAMSAEPERVFSGARRTISWERMQLGEDTIQTLECLKHWKRSGLVDNIMAGEVVDDD